MVGQAAPLGGNRGVSEAPVRFPKRRQASSVPARNSHLSRLQRMLVGRRSPRKHASTNGFEFAALLQLHKLARLSPALGSNGFFIVAPRCIRSAGTWCCDLAVCACGHDVQGVCWLFNGVITLADAADTESARTTNTNFRITLPVFCARQAPNHSGTQSHLLAWEFPEPGFAANQRLRDKTFPPRRALHRGKWEGRFKPFHMGYRLTWITFDFCRFRRS